MFSHAIAVRKTKTNYTINNNHTIKMTKTILTITLLSAFLLLSCTGSASKQDNAETTTENVADDIVTTTSTDKNGKELEITFNNTKRTATLNFEGETIELTQKRAASGIWYTNDQYELRGKGNDIELRKDGEVVFEHEDEIVTSTLTNKEGQTLHMVFNNTTREAKVYLDSGEQIDLVSETPASGIWYKNEHYELRGKGENVELTKDGETVFKN